MRKLRGVNAQHADLPKYSPTEIEPLPPICPRCEYDLRAISKPRCPECGTHYTWEQIQTFRRDLPSIAFERARGSAKVVGFVQTWLAVLFVPWVFAAQAARRISARHALVFGGLCFASTLLSFLAGNSDWNVIAAWLAAATVCILLEAVWLSLWDRDLRRAPLRTYGVWLMIGCYTSAVMGTEFYYGPPLMMFTDLIKWTAGFVLGQESLSSFSALQSGAPSVLIPWAQLGLWLIAVLCCLVARRARQGASGLVLVLSVLINLPILFLLYAFCVEKIGSNVYDFLERSF